MAHKEKKLASTLLRSVLVYSLVILLCFACVFSAFFYFVYERDEEARIEAVAQAAARSLDGGSEQDDIHVLESQLQADIRYTLIDADGDVIFDSNGSVNANHADRPEIIEARASGSSSVI